MADAARAAAQAAAHYNSSTTVRKRKRKRMRMRKRMRKRVCVRVHPQSSPQKYNRNTIIRTYPVTFKAGHVRQTMGQAQERRLKSKTAQLKKFHNEVHSECLDEKRVAVSF